MITAAQLYALFCQSEFSSYLDFLASCNLSYSEVLTSCNIYFTEAEIPPFNKTWTIKQVIRKLPTLTVVKENELPVPQIPKIYEFRKMNLSQIKDLALERNAATNEQYELIKAINDL